jgi:hypothetical protein
MQWKFDELDTDNDDVLINRELEAFTGLFQKEPCLYGFLRRCAQRDETGITRQEWARCLSDSRSTRYVNILKYIYNAGGVQLA